MADRSYRDDGGRAMTPQKRDKRYRAKRKAAGLPSRKTPQPWAPPVNVEAARARAKRYAATPKGKASNTVRGKRYRQKRTDGRPFVGVDGEGCGVDALGRQLYMLLRVGDAELFTGKPLTTGECFDFICDQPAGPIMVGFSFGYDVTMMLRDIPHIRPAPDRPSRLERIFADKEQGEHQSRYTYWQGFGIEYLPRNYLRICRTVEVWKLAPPTPQFPRGRRYQTRERVEGSTRTIYETFGFFQMSFLKTLQSYNVGGRHIDMIERNKSARGDFKSITKEVRRYCELECDYLAQTMELFRGVCHGTGLRPRSWNGAGKLAGFLHDEHQTMTRADLALTVPADVLTMASRAYYGGRFELLRIGHNRGHEGGLVCEADIRSAYPAAMLRLPCLVHGTWHEIDETEINRRLRTPDDRSLWLSPVQFRHRAADQFVCGLPFRQKDGRLCWPRDGRGTYWSVEIRSAQRLGCEVVAAGPGWAYQPGLGCQCQPFAWVHELYHYRAELARLHGKLRGLPLKLAINALYGRLAQRIGNPRWANMIWAGLITAETRAALNDAAATDPDAIIMFATDGIFSKRRLALPEGDDLGQWEHASHDRLFTVMPGIYWGPMPADGGDRKRKTRGVSGGFFALCDPCRKQGIKTCSHVTDKFETAWGDFAERKQSALPGFDHQMTAPTCSLDVTLFVGTKLALARGKPETAGKWVTTPRNFSFKWGGKRGYGTFETPLCVRTVPLPGDKWAVSAPHAADKKLLDELDLAKEELEDQPDYFSISPPWRD
jgi:hypothetical protein